MRFFRIQEANVLWGIVQNTLLILLFVSAVWYWAREKRIRSVSFTLIGALASSLLVRSTKPLAMDYNASREVTVVTMATMSVLQILLVTYLGSEAEWSNWRVDLGLGSLAGICLAVAQGLTSQGPSWVGFIPEIVMLVIGCVLVLLLVRKLKEQTLASTLAGALLLAVVMTLVAQAVGYQLILE